MNSAKTHRRWRAAWLTPLLYCFAEFALAHLMVAQRGTLHLVDNKAYMVMSIPVSALQGVDDDGDGLLSLTEGKAHLPSIEAQLQQGLRLYSQANKAGVVDSTGSATTSASVGSATAFASADASSNTGLGSQIPLQGVMVNLSPPDNAPTAPADHIVVLGTFVSDTPLNNLRFQFDLFGNKADEKLEQVTVSRNDDTQLISLSPEHNSYALLPSSGEVFMQQLQLGAEHILAGADHLLFLLVVLAAGWSLSQVLLALTCFTLGHAITLIACGFWGWKVSPAIVEPAIAATIVLMALFDGWVRRQSKTQKHSPTSAQQKSIAQSPTLRLSLVFACSLIHGLGLSEAFTSLGLSGSAKVWSLAGFNLGIEIGQLAVVLAVGVLSILLSKVLSPASMRSLAKGKQIASVFAIGLGIFWILQRITY